MKHEATIRLATGVVLWGISATMVGVLYASFAGEQWFAWPVACLLGIALEASKLLAWRRNGWTRLLAVSLSFLTVLSVMGTTLATIDARKANSAESLKEALFQSSQYKGLQAQLVGVDARERALLARMAVIPGDYTTATAKVLSALEVERKMRSSLTASIMELESTPPNAVVQGPALFGSIAKALGLDESNIELTIVLVLAVAIEISAFTLVGHSGPPDQKPGQSAKKLVSRVPIRTERKVRTVASSQSMVPASQRLSPEAYLAEALDHPRRPYLLGRGTVAERLGIQDREARALLEVLYKKGRIRRQSKFFVAVE